MDCNDYQSKSRKTATYPDVGNNFVYPALGLAGEAGEVADKVKKLIRDHGVFTPDQVADEQRTELKKELGDVLWYVTQLATEFGFTLSEVAEENIEKLYSRQDRDVLSGDGDNR